MKILKKITAAALAAVCMASYTAYADYNITVRMDAVATETSDEVWFGDVKPVQLESRTLVPARNMAEAAGMEVIWDQPTQTAILMIKIGLYSEKPIERYAAKAISMVEPPTPGLTPVDITAALRLDSSTAVIRYNFRDGEGDYISMGTEYELTSKTILVDNGTLMLPLRDSMEIFGLNVGWNQDTLCAYVSIPETVNIPDNLKVIPDNGEGIYAATEQNKRDYNSYSYEDLLNGGDGLSFSYEDAPSASFSFENNPDIDSEYLGTFKITHYCPCSICNGSWGNGTAWAGTIVPGVTIGVNPNVIPPLSWVYIDGYGMRRAEDTGSGIGTNHIDVAVKDHATVQSMSVVYRDVYLVRNYQP
ncbi:MAG: hypothetical protein IJH36_02730 [Clostridia bacterium]|nr:hypothetical protein [Clostridia bacterium]